MVEIVSRNLSWTPELIDLRSLSSNPPRCRLLCRGFYEQVYCDAFPKLDQSEGPEVWLPFLEHDALPPQPILHLILALEEGTDLETALNPDILGGVVIEFYRASRVALVTYIAVAAKWRHRGIGRLLLLDAISSIILDNNGVHPLILAEVERPEAALTETDRLKAIERLTIIEALGGWRIDTCYVQPRLSPEKQPLRDLMLVRLDPEAKFPRDVPAATLEAFFREFYASLDQPDSPDLSCIIGRLPTGNVALKSL